MTARTRARELLLSVVLFPLLAPVLVTAVVATRELLGVCRWVSSPTTSNCSASSTWSS